MTRLAFGPHVTRSELEHTTLLTTRNSQGTIARGNLAMLAWDATGALAKTNFPVLVLGGEIDIMTKPDASRAIAQQASKAQLRLIESANHMGVLDRGELYNKAIAEFARARASV